MDTHVEPGNRTAASRSLWFTSAVMLALALATYLPAALSAEFVAFDDNYFFGPDNPEFRRGLLAVFDPSRPIANAFLPVAHASLWLDWWMFDGRPFGPHLVSLLLHALVAVVFVRLLVRLRVAPLPANFAGALFLLHPALVESVSWVSGRKDLLAGLFVLLALLSTVRYAHAGGRWRVALAMLAAGLAMYAKATAVVLPLLAVLVCFASGGRRGRWVVPALIAAVVAPIALHHRAVAAAEGTLAAAGLTDRLVQVPGAFAHYLMTAVWPADLNVLYPEVQTLERFAAAFWPGVAIAAGVLLAAIALSAAPGPRRRLAGVGLLAFVVALLPFNTAWPASSIAAADRYLHLAIPGLALAVALALAAAVRRLGVTSRWLAVLLAVPLLAPLLWRSAVRAHDFVDTEALWRASLRVDADNSVAHYNLARELATRRPAPLDEVERHLRAAIAAARYPIHELRARSLLRDVLWQRAEYAAAAEQARGAIAAARATRDRETSPQRRAQADALLVEAHLRAFEPLRLAGEHEAAAASYREVADVAGYVPEVFAFGSLLQLAKYSDALRARGNDAVPDAGAADLRLRVNHLLLDCALHLHPDDGSLLFAKASWERARGETLDALRYYRRAQEVAPWRADAWRDAARMLRQSRLFEDAARYARDGLRHREDPALRQEWALALIGMGRLDDAIMQLEAYLRARPDDEDSKKILANVLIGRAYARLSDGGSHAEALRIVEQALALNPKEFKAHLVLGRVAREQRRFADAVAHLETSHELMPDYDEARSMLADSLRDLGMERYLKKDNVGAADAWLRFREVVPDDVETEGVELLLQGLWRRHERRGVELLQAGDHAGALAEFRACQRLDPATDGISWPFALALREQPDADLEEVERLARQAVDWQRLNGRDCGRQVYLLVTTLQRRDRAEAARQVAREYLDDLPADAEAHVVAALRAVAGG